MQRSLTTSAATGKLTLLANTTSLPNVDDPLGLTRAQFNANPRQPQPVAIQFNTRKSVHQEQGGAIYEQDLSSTQSVRALAYYGERDVQQFQSIPISTQQRPTSPGGVIDLDGNYGGTDLRWSYHDALAGRPFELTAGTSYDQQRQHRLGYNNFVGSVLGVQGALRRDEQDNESDFDQYVQGKWDFADRWSLTAGARHSEVRFDSADSYITATNGDDSGNVKYGATSPVAGLLFKAADDWNLYVSYGNGFETPTFNELGYRPDGSSGINFALVPSRSRNGEIGSKFRFGHGGEFDVAVFQADSRHELAVENSSGGRTTYQNVDKARRRGIETQLHYPISEQWRFEAAYTYLEANFESAVSHLPRRLDVHDAEHARRRRRAHSGRAEIGFLRRVEVGRRRRLERVARSQCGQQRGGERSQHRIRAGIRLAQRFGRLPFHRRACRRQYVYTAEQPARQELHRLDNRQRKQRPLLRARHRSHGDARRAGRLG